MTELDDNGNITSQLHLYPRKGTDDRCAAPCYNRPNGLHLYPRKGTDDGAIRDAHGRDVLHLYPRKGTDSLRYGVLTASLVAPLPPQGDGFRNVTPDFYTTQVAPLPPQGDGYRKK